MKNLDDALFSGKWELLQLLAMIPRNSTQLAHTLNTSLANVTQQLAVLEAYGLVTKEKETSATKRVGKPRLRYSIAKDVSYLGLISDGFAEKKALTLTGFHQVMARSLLRLTPEEHYALMKFLLSHDELLHKCDGICLLKTTKDSLELFLHSEHLDEIRKRYSNTIVQEQSGKNRKIICWTHSAFEIDEGLSHKDPYFINMLKQAIILQDRTQKLVGAKRLAEGGSE